MRTVLITEPISPLAVSKLESSGFLLAKLYEAPAPDPAAAVAAIVRSGYIDGAWMDAYPNLSIIAYHGVGTDDIDLKAAKSRGIAVATTPGQNSLSVAEHAMALILALSKSIPQVSADYAQSGFGAKYRHSFMELSGKTLGLIGLGDIGRRTAHMALHGFSMRVLAFDPKASDPPQGVTLCDERMDVFRLSDFVSLHLPMNAQTACSVGKAEFDAMKPTAFLINCARGAIVDEDALVHALKSGAIAGAGLDVTSPEPCRGPLLKMSNVILTPHVAASTGDALERVADMCVINILNHLRG